MLRRKIILLAVVLLLFMAAAFRLIGIDEHFTHIDDIGVAATILDLKELHANKNVWRKNFIAADQIPISWTYAPLQFCITTWLIDSEQSYRDILFWGRLPSTIFGILALVAMSFFLWKYFADYSALPLLVGLSILAFSWESIIYAQQMESYTIGIFAVAVLLLLLWHFLQVQTISLVQAAFIGIVLSLLFYAQYQLLFFLPAFFVSLLISQLKKNAWRNVVKSFLLSGSIVAVCFITLYRSYLSLHGDKGLNWNIGRAREFLFDMSKLSGFEKAVYPITFFAKNFYLTVKTNLAFIAEESDLYSVLGAVLFALTVIGFVRICVSKSTLKKQLGLFLLIFSLTWIVLCVLQKITFSPTRHSLVLQPLYILLVAEGLALFVEKLKLSERLQAAVGICFSGTILTLFLCWYSEIRILRQDPVDEKAMVELVKHYNVSSIYHYTYSENFLLMREINQGYVMDEGRNFTLRQDKGNTICLFSTRVPYPHELLNSNADFISDNAILPVDSVRAEYKLVYKKEVFSKTEVDFNTRTKNGTNEMFVYIFQKFR